ncbi:MAG: Asp-tRNA(Asn)/Glu-tRNA(Gln) amidotransferase subunit GatB [bacterium]|nr:Asp-tRNA(Asn)/Glu-tRNA(Gln) amidotransferase subunit GatB [bacterium]
MPSKHSAYQLVCGLEIHTELKTNSKMFCGCKNDPFGAAEPNIHTCPVCLGLPGALPVANKTAVEWTIKLGLALNCQINLFSKFDRKHYFYPDLPKGYQISQYDIPFCVNGFIETSASKIGIRRIHLEEDTGKLLHKTVNGEKVSLIDFNRSSVPLVEIVTEPDIHSAAQAKEYAKKIRQVVRYLDIADADMEQGGMRLEANISLKQENATALPGYKVEVKNINSFRFLELAIEYEVERQATVLNEGDLPTQETRGWDSHKNVTFTQRSKEDAEDYRYFPDPDLPPLRFTEEQIAKWRSELPELPEKIILRWQSEFGVEAKYSALLVEERADASYLNQVFTQLKATGDSPNKLANMLANKKITFTLPQDVSELVENYTNSTKLDTVDDEEIISIITSVKSENPTEVAAYQNGKTQLLNFFLGQSMRKLGKKVDANQLRALLEKHLAA